MSVLKLRVTGATQCLLDLKSNTIPLRSYECLMRFHWYKVIPTLPLRDRSTIVRHSWYSEVAGGRGRALQLT